MLRVFDIFHTKELVERLKWSYNMKKVTALLLVIAFIVLSCPLPTNASTTLEELKKAQEEKKKTEQQLNDTQEDLKNLQGIQDSLKVELSSLNTELKEVSNNLADLEEKIKIKQEEIETTTEALNEAKAIEAWQYDCMKKRIKFMYRSEERRVGKECRL